MNTNPLVGCDCCGTRIGADGGIAHRMWTMNVRTRLRLLRVFLFASAVAWGVALPGAFAPWPLVDSAMQGLGAHSLSRDPMVEYWIRMACGVYGGVGILFLMMAFRPDRFLPVIPIAGGLMAFEGVLLAFYAVRLHLSPVPCAFDTLFCIFAGTSIATLGRSSDLVGRHQP